jgi:hypothetical protein
MTHDTPWLAERIEPKLAELRYEVERLQDALRAVRSACALPAWDRAAYIAVADQGAYLEACAHAVGVTHGIVDRALGKPEPLPIPPDGPHLSARFSCLPEALQEYAVGTEGGIVLGNENPGSAYYWTPHWLVIVVVGGEDVSLGRAETRLDAAEIIAAHMWATQEATQ